MHRLAELRANIQKAFMGSPQAVDRLLVCVLARGHVLIEDVPGVGKTMLATALARSLDCGLSRIQLTPDMLPSDLLGVTVWDQHQARFVFKPGPIFAHVVLADEINRTPPRTQSALLEAMNEAQVSIDGETRPLPAPFLVIATQNPFEFEGTYPLPESQLDRFLMRLHLGYPAPQDEARILTLEPARTALGDLRPVLSAADLLALQERVHQVKVDGSITEYVVRLAQATRRHAGLTIGVSPRGALSLMQAARATALVQGRDFVIPDDVTGNVPHVWSHRIVVRGFAQETDGQAAARVLDEVLRSVPSPS